MLSLTQFRVVAVAACANFAWLAATGRFDPMSAALVVFCVMWLWAGREDLVYRLDWDRKVLPRPPASALAPSPTGLYAHLETVAWNRLSGRSGFDPSWLHALDGIAIRLAARFPDAGAALLLAELKRAGMEGDENYPGALPDDVFEAADILSTAQTLAPLDLARKAAGKPLVTALLRELSLLRLGRNPDPLTQAREGEILFRLSAAAP